MKKLLQIFQSARFIQLVIVAILQSLVLFNVLTTEQSVGLVNIISALFGASVVIGTVDKNTGEARIESAKLSTGTTTVTIPDNVSEVTASTKVTKKVKK